MRVLGRHAVAYSVPFKHNVAKIIPNCQITNFFAVWNALGGESVGGDEAGHYAGGTAAVELARERVVNSRHEHKLTVA